jgi:hypothetical protein
MHQKAYEMRCIALVKKFPHAINIPQPPKMFTPFLVRAEVYISINAVVITSKICGIAIV